MTQNRKKIKDQGLLISILANLLLAILLAIAFIVIPDYIGNDPAISQLDVVLAKSGLTMQGAIAWGLIAIAIIICLIKVKYWRWPGLQWFCNCQGYRQTAWKRKPVGSTS